MAKKTAAAKSAPKKTSGQRYSYSQLAQVGLASGESEAHVYGVIVDATFPYKVNKERFICSLKVVDPSLNGAGKSDDWATVVLYANRFEDLPIVHRLGDIIRVHRATLRLYDDKRQFNVNVQHNGSWCLFSTDRSPPLGGTAGDSSAFAHSGKRHSFEKHEVSLLASLRKWASSYFASQNAVRNDKCVDLKAAGSGKGSDFDVLAKVTQLHEFDEYTNELCLRDGSGDSWYTLATKLKFPHLRQGQVVKIRSVQHDSSSSKNMLTQQHYSNIMTLIGGSKAAKGLAGVKHAFNRAALNSDGANSHAVVLSQVGAKYSDMPTTSLRDLFHRENTLSGSTFRVQLQVLAVQPGDANKMVVTKKGAPYWQVQLLCKDASTVNSGSQYRVLNYSNNALGGDFFGAAGAFNKAKVEAQVANLTRFNSWVDAVVEKSNGFYYIRDTKLVH
jgi:hypothetical protein